MVLVLILTYVLVRAPELSSSRCIHRTRYGPSPSDEEEEIYTPRTDQIDHDVSIVYSSSFSTAVVRGLFRICLVQIQARKRARSCSRLYESLPARHELYDGPCKIGNRSLP